VDFKPGDQSRLELVVGGADCAAVICVCDLPQHYAFVPSLNPSGMAQWDVAVERAVNEKDGHERFRDFVFWGYFRGFQSVLPL